MCKGCLECPLFQQLLQSCCVCHNPKLYVSCMPLAGEFLACTHTHMWPSVWGLESVRTILYMVRVDCIHWIDIYERCQVWVVQERRGAFAFEWGPVSLSFYVRLVLVKPTGSVRLMQSTAFFASSSASTTSCVIPMSKGSHDSVHSIFLICSFLFRPCNFAAT